jgi:glycosyltransferase involved in cell wall biosynthesis
MISVNVTIHNKGFLLERVLNAIKQNTVLPYEIITVLDGCTDNSEQVLFDWINKNTNVQMKVMYADNVFETPANNMAAKQSSEKYIAIIQDDCIVTEKGWDKRIIKPMQLFSDVFAVTGRCTHNYIFNPASQHVNMVENLDNCWCDILIATDHSQKIIGQPRDQFVIRNSINRSPFVVRNDVLNTMGYFDEAYAPQDQDDHDLCYRTYEKLGMVCGCYWVDWVSELEWGGTRPDGANPAAWLLKTHHKNSKILYSRFKNVFDNHFNHNETRICL